MMKSVPRFLRGPYGIAMRVALEEMVAGYRSHNLTRQERGWKLFLLLPRMLLQWAQRWRNPRPKLLERFEMFVRKAAVARRRRARGGDDINKTVDRAEALVHLGELSSARQALEGAELVPGSQQTSDILRDQSKRRRETRVPTSPELVHHSPSIQSGRVSVSQFEICEKRGCWRPVRDDRRAPPTIARPHEGCKNVFPGASKCARHSQVGLVHSPPETRWWRQRHRGRGRREKVGGKDNVATEAVQGATAPFQYALATRAGCECVAHALHGITELNPRATVTSIDGDQCIRLNLTSCHDAGSS